MLIRTIAYVIPDLLNRVFRNSTAPLLRGDRLAAAQAEWHPDKWPTVYRPDIPADIRRPVVWDGRILGGKPVTWLAWRHFTPAVIKEAAFVAGRSARNTALVFVALFALVFAYSVYENIGMSRAYPAWAWEAGAYGVILGHWLSYGLYVAETFVSATLRLAVAGGLIFVSSWYFGFWRSIRAWFAEASAPLATPTRDATLLWKTRADIRDAEYSAYARQVREATGRLAEMPVIAIGKAEGVLRARGDMESPTKGQLVAYDGESIRNHTIVLGGTGVGKTRLAIRPLFDRIMTADWGKDHRIGAYVTDGKGTLWRDVLKSVADRDDVRILGTDEGQFGCDLTAGMTPLEISTTFKAVSGQVAGKPADDFWPESASLKVMHSAAVNRILDADEEGRKLFPPDVRPYSLVGIGLVAGDDALLQKACARIADILDETSPADRSSELVEAVQSAEWQVRIWLPMASETRSGIVANVNVVLGKLTGAGELARRFCKGSCSETIDVSHALGGGVLMVAVSETEWGLAGRVVNVWLKTRLYVGARHKLVSDPEGCRSTSCAVIADEYQMLVTSGPDSDTSFWNIARETGLFLIAATQSVAALQQVLGPDQTSNVLNLLRTKIVLKTEELSTIEFVRKLAGELPRGWETEPDFFPTQGARELAYPDRPPGKPKSAGGFFPTSPMLETLRLRDVVSLDRRFMVSAGLLGDASAQTQAINSQQAAYWRQEDRAKAEVTGGLQWRPKIESDELLLGSGYAFVVAQRAGVDRSDICDLEI